jgi:hypothetical protein
MIEANPKITAKITRNHADELVKNGEERLSKSFGESNFSAVNFHLERLFLINHLFRLQVSHLKDQIFKVHVY